MRICYIADGLSIHTQRWLNFFARKGHEVHLISSRFTTGYEGYDKRIEMHPLVRLLPQIWKVSGYLSGVFWLSEVRQLVKKIKPDVLDAHYITINGYLGVISGFHPLILTAWGSDVLITPKRSSFHKYLTKYALKKAQLVTCSSENLRKELLTLDVNPTKIRIVRHGVDTQLFSPQMRDKSVKSRLGMLDVPTIICTRNLKPIYNVEMLIKAMPLVLGQVPEARFVLAGDGEQRAYLESLANSLGILDSIKFVGWVPHNELPEYLASSDIYVSTSLSDSASVSLEEAMACQLAPVVTDLPANREWITDGENGFIVPLNDIQALADKIVFLLRNGDIREEFGKKGRKIITDRAEYEKEMSLMEKLYEGLVRKEDS